MYYSIEHEVPGRLRVRLNGVVREGDVDPLLRVLLDCPAVTDATIYPRIGSVAVAYAALEGESTRRSLLDYLATVDAEQLDAVRSDYTYALATRTHDLVLDLACTVGGFVARRLFLPAPLALVYAIWQYRHFLWLALVSLGRGKLDVASLDAAAIGASFAQGDASTASETMFLLDVGEVLEDYTRAQSANELIYSLLSVPDVAARVERGQELSVPATDLVEGDLVVVRTGQPVPIDGTVERGVGMVNQAALTGEPLSVERAVGDSVYAGTTMEEGEIFVRVSKPANKTRLRSIVSLVEQSEEQKSVAEARRERLANGIVPWNFLLSALVALVTRNPTKIAASLMVDYTCALKLTGSVSVLSAMSEGARAGISVKGSRHFEEFAQADTIVFDKTGTLTEAVPRVRKVIALNGYRRDQVLRLSACLEEHYPHPVARAVVKAAADKNLKHRERHAKVEYVVAHGLVSSLDAKRVVIGSPHFVMGDERVEVGAEQRRAIEEEVRGLSALYLAVDGVLVGVIGIEDPIKKGAKETVRNLRTLGFEHVVMLTGDNEAAAQRVAESVGVTEWAANMLPEQKHEYVRKMRESGRRVVMVGDGVNDSPALKEANVGVAMAAGTAIAREVADITLTDPDLGSLVRLRKLSQGLMNRLDRSFWEIMLWNSALLALGIGGVMSPQTSSLLHNASTVALGASAMRSYL
ncbi:MAG: heavy metal translocating P-type ATPase [Atopobiaceae bacterium]|nr:heavy metal translocating P-type ATPase [Atopobiaceae bacterium]